MRKDQSEDVPSTTYAYPDGLPGGWNFKNKVHLIGHSMGSQTIRYLQYLLSIDYFNQNQIFDRTSIPLKTKGLNYDYSLSQEHFKAVDKSGYIASVTSINGMINGGTISNTFDANQYTLKHEFLNSKHGQGSRISDAIQKWTQMFCVIDNLTSRSQNDNVKRIFKQDGQTVFELGQQQNHLIYDGYAETWGLDRKKDENILCYISRVFNDPILRDSYCVGMPECHAGYMTRMNQHIKTSDETYYFAISTGERNKQREKAREVFKEPMKISSFSLGFDDDVTQSIKFRADVAPLKRRKRQITIKEKVEVNLKHLLNSLDLIQKLHTDN